MLENIRSWRSRRQPESLMPSLWSFLIWGMRRRLRTPRPFTQHCRKVF
jgi:hypothetical protein